MSHPAETSLPVADSFMGRPERLVHIEKQHGFLPRTNREAATVMALLGRPDSPHKVTLFLNDIYAHQLRLQKEQMFAAAKQRKEAATDTPVDDVPEVQLETAAVVHARNMDELVTILQDDEPEIDPRAAIRSVTREFVDNALSADDTQRRSVRLSYELDRMEVDASLPVTDVLTFETWSRDPNMMAALTDLTQRAETIQYMKDGERDGIGALTGVSRTSGQDRFDRILQAINGLSVADVQERLLTMVESEEKRREYWKKQIIGASGHVFVRQIATRALAEL